MKKRFKTVLCLMLAVMLLTTFVFADSSKQFKDVKQNSWYVPYVDYVVEQGMMAGISETSFNPNGVVTRGQFVTTLYAMADKPEAEGESSFKDLKKGAFYVNAVNWASSTGVTSGLSEEEFAPDKSVTREQAATFLRAYMIQIERYTESMLPKTSILGYPDYKNVSKFAYDSIRWAVGVGVISGVKTDDGRSILQPRGTLTRAQLATMLKSFNEYLKGNTVYVCGKKTDDNDVPQGGISIELFLKMPNGTNKVIWSCVTESDGEFCATLAPEVAKEELYLRFNRKGGSIITLRVPISRKHVDLTLTDTSVMMS